MSNVLLTDAEVKQFCDEECSHKNYCALKVKCDKQCLDQARKVVNWLYGICDDHNQKVKDKPILRFDCPECMVNMKKELES